MSASILVEGGVWLNTNTISNIRRDKFIEMATGPIVVFELTKQGALQELEKLMSGPTPLSHLAGKNAGGCEGVLCRDNWFSWS